MLVDVPRGIWILALIEAKPSQLSRCSKTLWSLLFGLMQPGELPKGWPDDAHIRDFRPPAVSIHAPVKGATRRSAHCPEGWSVSIHGVVCGRGRNPTPGVFAICIHRSG